MLRFFVLFVSLGVVFSTGHFNGEDKKICYQALNKLRSLHDDTHSLERHDGLGKQAQMWAQNLANKGVKYGDVSLRGTNVGENIYVFRDDEGNSAPCVKAALAWYYESADYDFEKGHGKTLNAETRHFTQLVWRNSRHVGLGYATKKRYGKMETYVVARFTPKGNVDGGFLNNVGARLGGVPTPSLQELDPREEPTTPTEPEKECKDTVGYCSAVLSYCESNKKIRDICAESCGLC